jgi:broad specificity phosphatase PhoE
MSAGFLESDRFVDLLRHGEVEGGARFRGGRDDALTDLGWEQMARATANEDGWTEILSSPLQRCASFARRLAEARSLPLRFLDDLRERRFGDWEGLSASEIPPEDLARFWANPASVTPPGAEPFDAFRERVLRAWKDLLATECRHPLVVTHSGVIRVLTTETLRMPDEALLLIEIPFASFTRLRIHEPPGRPSLVFHRPPTR